jgi:hypothetical protein
MATSEHEPVGVKDLFWTTEENLRYAKRQQFAVANYVILVYAALFGLVAQLTYQSSIAASTLRPPIALLGLVVMIFGYAYVCSFQFWMIKSRRVLNKLYRAKDSTTREFRRVKGRQSISLKFRKDSEVVAGIVFLESASYSALIVYLTRSLCSAAIVFVVSILAFFVVLCVFSKWKRYTRYLSLPN